MNSFTNLYFNNINHDDIGCWEIMKQKTRYATFPTFVIIRINLNRDILYYIIIYILYRMDAPLRISLDKRIFSSNEIEYLYTIQKTLNEPIEWKPNKEYTKYISQVGICINTIIFAELRLRYNIGGEIFFRLQTKHSHQPIRMFHYQPNHKHENPDGIIIESEHKHNHLEEYAYKVHNINISDINLVLFDFLDECNIKYDSVIDVIQLKRPFTFLKTLNQFGGKI